MRTIAIACALVVSFASASLARDLAVPKSTLASMGLASMTPLSDNVGSEVRGKFIMFDAGVIRQLLINASTRLSDASMRLNDAAMRLGDASMRLGDASMRLGDAAMRLGDLVGMIGNKLPMMPR